MRFADWLFLEATLSRKGIDVSTPENISYLSTVPRKHWVHALAKKHSDFLINYVNQGMETFTLNPTKKSTSQVNPHMKSLVQQLQNAGVDIRDMSRETRSGDALALSPTHEADMRKFRRIINKWIAISLGLPQKSLQDPQVRATYAEKIQNFQASDLQPNVGIMWTPNNMESSVNTYDDNQEQDKALWALAKKLTDSRITATQTPQQVMDFIRKRAEKVVSNYVAKGKLSPDQAAAAADFAHNYIIQNLRSFAEAPKPAIWLGSQLNNKVKHFINNGGISAPKRGTSIQQRRDAYNQQQAISGYANPTTDTHRLQDDPMTLRNRLAQSPAQEPIPLPLKQLSAKFGNTPSIQMPPRPPEPEPETPQQMWASWKNRRVGQG